MATCAVGRAETPADVRSIRFSSSGVDASGETPEAAKIERTAVPTSDGRSWFPRVARPPSFARDKVCGNGLRFFVETKVSFMAQN